MAWQPSRLERLNGIHWSWVQIPLRLTFYSYFKEIQWWITYIIYILYYIIYICVYMSCTKISKYISKTRHQRCFTTIYELLQILESQDLKGHVYFGPCLPKFTKVIFSFPKFESSVCKNQLNSSLYLWDTADLRVQWPKGPSSFLTMPTQILSNQRLVSMNLYWHAKKKSGFLINLF